MVNNGLFFCVFKRMFFNRCVYWNSVVFFVVVELYWVIESKKFGFGKIRNVVRGREVRFVDREDIISECGGYLWLWVVEGVGGVVGNSRVFMVW